MTAKSVTVLIGHPDPSLQRLIRKLALAYAQGARDAGCQVHLFDIAEMSLDFLRAQGDFESNVAADSDVAQLQAAIRESSHFVLFHPLWLGGMPALLKALFEQLCRGDFVFNSNRSPFARKLAGRSARVIITMGMPMLLFRVWFGMPCVKLLKRHILGFVGFRPVRHTLIGSVGQLDDKAVRRWLSRMEELGRRAI